MSETEILQKVYKKFTFAPVLDNTRGKMTVNQWYADNKLSYYKKVGMLGHGALDMRAKIGTPTYAAFDGVVENLYSNSSIDEKRGEFVRLISKEFTIAGVTYRLRSNHYHLHVATVKMGEAVKAGQQVGETGNTGKITTGAHLHFAIKLYKKVENHWTQAFPNNGYFGAIDPYPFFKYKDFNNHPSKERRLTPGMIVKNRHDAKVYLVNADKTYAWIANEATFNLGHSLGWWGSWGKIKEVDAKIIETIVIKVYS